MAEQRNVTYGPIEKVRKEPVDFRVIKGRHVVPVYVLGRKRYETWWEDGKKMGRWTWEYI